MLKKQICCILICFLMLFSCGCSNNDVVSTDMLSVADNSSIAQFNSSETIVSDGASSETSSEESLTSSEGITSVDTSSSIEVVAPLPKPETNVSTNQQQSVTPCGVPFTDEAVNALNGMMDTFSGHVSVVFYDINSGYTYSYNPEHSYTVASIIKAPFCLYIYQLADSNQTNLDETIKYTSDFYAGGTGKIKNGPQNIDFSKRTLLEYAIRYSDNVALKMLRSQYTEENFKQFAAGLGIKDVEGIKNISNGRITGQDALVYMKEIYRFIYSGSENGQKLRTDMLNTTNPMIKSSYPVVRKYGWADKSFHDIAIIEAPNPYILIILSDHENGTGSDFAMFETISKRIEAYVG